MFDTHCHLNFKAFAGKVNAAIKIAKKEGVTDIVVPGTDIESSKKAVEIAVEFEHVYAAVGIHPHHVFNHVILRIPPGRETPESLSDSGRARSSLARMTEEMKEIEKLLNHKKVVAVGEVGLDRHYYDKTKYPDYQINKSFMQLQTDFLRKQIDLAIKYKKSIIFHNREAKNDFLQVLTDYATSLKLRGAGRCVFHCCEPDQDLLEFAAKNKIFIGVDGDITYRKDKQEFIKQIPLEMLVLETDSPFLLPVQLRTDNKKRPKNEPKNLKLIAEFIANIIGINYEELESITEENSKQLFQLV